jgi:hypothetical protein
MRKQEIVEARPDWFQLEANRLVIDVTPTFRPKDREARTLPLTKSFRDFLSSYGMRSPFMHVSLDPPKQNRFFLRC